MRSLDELILPLVKQGHKIMTTNSGPGRNFIQLLHPDTIKEVVGSGIIIVWHHETMLIFCITDPKLKATYHALNPWLGMSSFNSRKYENIYSV